MTIFIYGERDKSYILDVTKTELCLSFAYNYLKNASREKKTFLFVCTKKRITPIVKWAAKKCGASYIISRWRLGTLTNWKTCHFRIVYFNTLSLLEKTGKTRGPYTKKENARLKRVRKNLKRVFGGLKIMRIPDCVIVIDPKHERKAVLKCVKLEILVVSILDANANPNLIDIPIPVSATSIQTLKYVLSELCCAILRYSD